jgi:hypothetical protein
MKRPGISRTAPCIPETQRTWPHGSGLG